MLVGRESEFARLTEAVREAKAGRGSALVLTGEPGIGKTALLTALVAEASEMQVLRACGVEAESALAYAGLSELLAPTLGLLGRIPERRRSALEAALGLSDATAVDPFGAYAATLSLLAEVADEQAALIVVDDAHLLDPESLNALRFSARRLMNDRVCIVLATREEQTVAFDSPGFETLRVRGLDREAAGALLRTTATVGIAPEAVDVLHDATGGNPLALRELARALTPAQLAGHEGLSDPLPAGPEIARAFGARLDALPARTQQALVVASADRTGDIGTLGRALRSFELDLADLAEAEGAELVSLENGQVEFCHPLIRAAAYRRSSPQVRRDAHAALAAAVGEGATNRVRRAWHLAAAALEPDEHVALELEAVAAEARGRAAPAVAGRAWEAAVRASGPGRARVRRLINAAEAHHHAGAPDHAIALLDLTLSELDDPLDRADAQRLRAQIESLRGAAGPVRAMLIEEAGRVEPHDPARAAAMRLEAAATSTMMGEPRIAGELAEQAWATAQAGDPDLRRLGAFVTGGSRLLRGETRTGSALLREVALAIEQGDASPLGLYTGQLTMAEICAGRASDALRFAAAAVSKIRAEGSMPALPPGLWGLAWAQMVLGDWRAAEATTSESMAIADEVGQLAFKLQGHTLLVLILGARGRIDEARQHAASALEQGERYGIHSARTVTGWALGRLELGIGDYGAAATALKASGRFSLERGLEEPAVAPWAQDLAEAYVRLGRHGEAEMTLAILERQAERTGGPGAHAGALRCRGLLAADDRLDERFQAALSWHDRLQDPFERARTELCYGERLRRVGRRNDARRALRAALGAFEELGAEPWAERVASELRASGEHARRRTPDTADRLTPQELQVAALVAEGATNREAAAALFVSPKTVETHLSHIYRKLGVRSRTRLAHRLHTVDGSSSPDNDRRSA